MTTEQKEQTLMTTALCKIKKAPLSPRKIVGIVSTVYTISSVLAMTAQNKKDGIYSSVPLDYTLSSRIIFIIKKIKTEVIIS